MKSLLVGRRAPGVALAIALIIGVALGAGYYAGFLRTADLRTNDVLFRIDRDASAAADERIIIVAIDDRSLAGLGHISSWPRSYYAGVVDKLTDAGARVVVFDVLFAEPAPGDEILAESMKRAGNVLMPVAYAPPAARSAATAVSQTDNFIRPVPALAGQAAATGHANMSPDADGVGRRISLAIPEDNGYQPALALVAAARYLRRPQVFEAVPTGMILPFAGREIPLDAPGDMLINYSGLEKSDFPTVCFVDVLNGAVRPEVFRDRIVLIGSTATGLADYFWTPLGKRMPGVQIHAAAIHTILTSAFLKPAPQALLAAIILALALMTASLATRLRVSLAVLATLSLLVIYLLAAFASFDSGVMLSVFYPPLGVALTFGSVNVFNVVRERAERAGVTRTFGRYVSAPVADRALAAPPDAPELLSSEECMVTTLFADVRNFTGLSEKAPPQELLRRLNQYLSVIIKAVTQYHGTVNKFGGDSVMAIWNAPVACQEHALLATRAALAAARGIALLAEQEEGLPEIGFGFGINTGTAAFGNVGSAERLEYTVIGDSVNLAARLGSAAPAGKIWVGEATFQSIRDTVAAKALPPLTVKGRAEPLVAYDVTGAVTFEPGETKQRSERIDI